MSIPGTGDPPVGSFLSLLRAVLRSRTARDTSINAAGTGVSAALSFAALILATRWMGPSGYGLFALALAVLSMASELADLGINAGLIRHVSRHLGRGDTLAARTVLSVAFRAKLATAAAAGLLALALARPAAAVLQRPGAVPLLRLAALGLAGTVLLGLTSATLQAHQRFARNAILGSGHWGMRLAGTAVLAASGRMSPVGLLWVYALTPWLAFLLGVVLVPRGAITWRLWDLQRAREVFHFSRWIALWALFSILVQRIDLLLLGGLSTDDQVGYYSAAQRVSLLVTLLVNAYLMTLVPKLSRLTDLSDLRRSVRRALGVAAAISAGIVVLILASPLLVLAFGQQFGPAGPVLAVVLLGSLFHALALPFNSALYAINRPQAFALESGLALIVSLAGNLLLIPRFGAMGAAMTSAAIGLLVVSVAFLLARGRGLVQDLAPASS